MLRSAQIDLARTTIRAPISGRIGRSTYTIGALVSASQTDPLTTIQRLDPIFVDIQQSSADVLRLRQQLLSGDISRGSGAAQVKLKLEDGSTYPEKGVLKFTDVTVDPTTGSQIIRAQFPNPRGLLLPGMYVRAELVDGTKSNGLLVPQVAVSRDEKGNPTVLIVGPENKVEMRKITAPRRSEEHTSELQSLMRISYAVFCLKKNIQTKRSRMGHTTDITNVKATQNMTRI